MANAMLGWRNHVVTGAVTANGAVPSMPATKIQNDYGNTAEAWQTPAGVTTGWLRIDTGDPDSVWQAFLLARTNLTEAAVFRIRIGPPATVVSAPDYNSFNFSGLVAGYQQILHIAAAPQAGQVCRIDITDPTNPDGFLHVALAYAGPVFQPQVNLSPQGTADGRDARLLERTARGGTEYPDLLSSQRRGNLAFQGLLVAEAWPEIMDLDRHSRRGGNVLYVPDPANIYLQRQAVFGRLTVSGDLAYPYVTPERRSWSARVTERL